MRFIRKNGRVIPIRDERENGVKKSLVAGASTAIGAYAISRTPVPSKTKELAEARSRFRATEHFNQMAVTHTDVSMKIADKMGVARTYPGATIPTSRATPNSLKKFRKDGKPFLIKPNDDAMKTMGQFLTNRDKITKNSLTGKNVIQEKLKLTHEYRVTTSAGKVTSITHRRLPGTEHPIGAFIPVNHGRSEIKNFVESSMKNGKVHPHHTGILGIDVGRTKNGLKIIETNVYPGDLLNPIKRIKAKTYLLGRLPRVPALALSAVAGIAAYKFYRREKKK